MKRILISGYYGFGNTGDEAILSSMIYQIKEKISDCIFTVVSENPDETKKFYDVDAIYRLDFDKISQEIEKSDLVILGGGGLFQDHHKIDISATFAKPGYGITRYVEVPLMAKMHGKPVMFYSQGFGPLFSKEAKTFVSFVCSLADIITTRDEESKNLLEEIGVDDQKIIVSIDPAFEIQVVDKSRVKEILANENIPLNEKLVCVSVRQWIDKSLEDKYVDDIAASLEDFLGNHNVHLLFIPFQDYNQHGSDSAISARIIESISMKERCHLLSKIYHPREIAGIMGETDLVIGMRYHSVIFPIISNVPVVALSYDPKVKNLMKDLNLNEFCLDIFNKDNVLLKDILNKAWNDRAEIQRKMSISYSRLKSRNYSPSIVHSFLGGPKFNELYPDSLVDISDEIYKLKSIETIHYQAKLLSFLQLEYKNQIESYRNQMTQYKNQINDLEGQNHILKSNIQAIHSSKSWKLLYFIVKCIKITKNTTFAIGGRIFPDFIKRPLRKILFKQFTKPSEEPLPRDLIRFLRDINKKGKKMKLVVVFSGTRFIESEGQRPIRIAKELAKRGNYILFAYWRWTPNECGDYGKKNDNIFLLAIDQLFKYTKQISEFEFSNEISKIFLMEFPHPFLFELLSFYNTSGWTTIYDVMDDWEEFNKVGQANWYDKDLEQYIIRNSDIITAVSPPLVEKLKKLGADDVELIPNAVDPDILSNKPARKLKKGRITIGYFGHLTSAWFDWDLIIKLANKNSDWMFHLIGYGEPQITLPINIFLHGKIKPQELSSYVKNWDVAIIPFKTTSLSEAVDPIKIYEYLYFHLPVVVKGIHHLERYPHILIADSFEDFENCIIKASNIHIKELNDFIKNNTWKNRVNELEKQIYNVETTITLKNVLEGKQ